MTPVDPHTCWAIDEDLLDGSIRQERVENSKANSLEERSLGKLLCAVDACSCERLYDHGRSVSSSTLVDLRARADFACVEVSGDLGHQFRQTIRVHRQRCRGHGVALNRGWRGRWRGGRRRWWWRRRTRRRRRRDRRRRHGSNGCWGRGDRSWCHRSWSGRRNGYGRWRHRHHCGCRCWGRWSDRGNRSDRSDRSDRRSCHYWRRHSHRCWCRRDRWRGLQRRRRLHRSGWRWAWCPKTGRGLREAWRGAGGRRTRWWSQGWGSAGEWNFRWRRCRCSRKLLNIHNEIADVDLVTRLNDERRGDLATIDVGAVCALQVNDNEAVVFENNPRVTLADVAFGQDDIVALNPPNGDFILIEFHPALTAAFFRDHDCEHRSFVPFATPSTFRFSERPKTAPIQRSHRALRQA